MTPKSSGFSDEKHRSRISASGPRRDRVGAAPAAIAPRQVPSRPRRQRVGHEVEAGRAERLAAQHACERHPSAGPKAMAREGFVGILRAGRQVPAVPADQGRQGELIRLHRRPGEDLRRARPRFSGRRNFGPWNLGRRFHRIASPKRITKTAKFPLDPAGDAGFAAVCCIYTSNSRRSCVVIPHSGRRWLCTIILGGARTVGI